MTPTDPISTHNPTFHVGGYVRVKEGTPGSYGGCNGFIRARVPFSRTLWEVELHGVPGGTDFSESELTALNSIN